MKKKIASTKKARASKSWNLLEPGDTNTFLLILISVMFLIVSVFFASSLLS